MLVAGSGEQLIAVADKSRRLHLARRTVVLVAIQSTMPLMLLLFCFHKMSCKFDEKGFG